MQTQPLNSLKTVSKISDLSSMITMTAFCLVCSLRSAQLDIAWKVKNMAYFDLIG